MQQEQEYVLTVWQERSFSRAAEKLFITQPALSMAIQKVENQLGAPIFDRSTRPISLTETGQAYLAYIRDTQALDREFQEKIADIRELNTGVLRIGGSHYLNAFVLPDILSAFMDAYPKISVELVEESSAVLSDMLSRKELDLTFSCNPRLIENFDEKIPAFTDHLLLAVPAAFPVCGKLAGMELNAYDVAAGKHLASDCLRVGMDAFRDVDFILLKPGNNAYDRAIALCSDAGFTPKIRMSLAQQVTSYRMAGSGIGAAFISDRMVKPVQDDLNYYVLNSSLADRVFYMLPAPKSYKPVAVKTFMQFFRAHI